jgi:methyl-galactoside transport system substrate-binding protein
MRPQRRAFALVALALISLFAASCAKREPKVGLFVYNESDPFMQAFASQIMTSALGSLDMELFYADNSQLLQNEQIERCLAEKPALMLINPVDRLGSFAIIRRLRSEGVPVIFFNREPLAEDLALWDRTYYVGARAAQSGQLQAELAMKLFGGDSARLNRYDRNGDGRIQTIILKGEQGHQDAETRTSEVQKSFKAHGFRLEVLALEVANWEFESAYTKMGRILEKYQGSIELVLANNDDMALGAIARMRQAGIFQDTNGNGKIDRYDANWIPVVGINGLPEAEKSVSEGYLYGTVKNDSLGMASSIVELANVTLGKADNSTLSVPLIDGKYIWIDYQPFVSQE